MGIVVIGSVFVDVKGYPIGPYIPAGRNAGRVVTVHGGVARNLAEDLGNVHVNPIFVGTVDDTGTGEDVIRHLQRHHVNTDFVRRIPDGMGTWLAVFDNNGDVVASISKRPDLGEIKSILREEGDQIFSQADSVVCEMDMEEELLELVIGLAQKYNKAVYGLISNMSIAMERRELITHCDCLVCNQQEAGLLFSEDYSGFSAEDMVRLLPEKVKMADYHKMVVTMGEIGAVYATREGEVGFVPATKVDVVDTTGCGDAFCAGVSLGLTYHKSLQEACEIGTRLATAVVSTRESTCPRFRAEEFDIHLEETR